MASVWGPYGVHHLGLRASISNYVLTSIVLDVRVLYGLNFYYGTVGLNLLIQSGIKIIQLMKIYRFTHPAKSYNARYATSRRTVRTEVGLSYN